MQISIYHPELKNIDAVIFDLDGTLYNRRGFIPRLIVRLLPTLPYLIRERLTRRALSGKNYGSERAFRDAFFCKNARFERWYDQKEMPAMVDILSRHHHSEAWARELITELRRRDIKIAVYSDYDAAPAKLRALGYQLSDFDLIISASEVGGLKPAKESMEQVIKRLGEVLQTQREPSSALTADRVLVVGDRDKTDGASARAVGARFMLVS